MIFYPAQIRPPDNSTTESLYQADNKFLAVLSVISKVYALLSLNLKKIGSSYIPM
jgi:hypothetical protein